MILRIQPALQIVLSLLAWLFLMPDFESEVLALDD